MSEEIKPKNEAIVTCQMCGCEKKINVNEPNSKVHIFQDGLKAGCGCKGYKVSLTF